MFQLFPCSANHCNFLVLHPRQIRFRSALPTPRRPPAPRNVSAPRRPHPFDLKEGKRKLFDFKSLVIASVLAAPTRDGQMAIILYMYVYIIRSLQAIASERQASAWVSLTLDGTLEPRPPRVCQPCLLWGLGLNGGK